MYTHIISSENPPIWHDFGTTPRLARLTGDLIQSKGQLPLRLELRQRLPPRFGLFGLGNCRMVVGW